MSSYLSNLLTHTTSRYASLRRTLLSTEDDGDTPDDTHICRVLRAYYTEKGRPFPDWLPPDPNVRKSVQPVPSSGGWGVGGGRGPVGNVQAQSGPGQRASLSDLWDAPGGGQGTGPPSAPQSLRAARRTVNAAAPSTNPVGQQGGGGGGLAPPQARPLPSQRAGSHQSFNSSLQMQGGYGGGSGSRPGSGVSYDGSVGGGGGGGTAQERLKARLWGGARAAGAQGGGGGGGGGYESSGQQGGGGYEDGRRYGR